MIFKVGDKVKVSAYPKTVKWWKTDPNYPKIKKTYTVSEVTNIDKFNCQYIGLEGLNGVFYGFWFTKI